MLVPVRFELNLECTNMIGDYSNALYSRLDTINMSSQNWHFNQNIIIFSFDVYSALVS